MSKPFQNWKHALAIFHTHENTKYHRDCQLAADNFLQTFSGSVQNVIDQLDQGRQSKIRENRRKLTAYYGGSSFCGQQGLALHVHRGSGPMDLSGASAKNTGILRALLRMVS